MRSCLTFAIVLLAAGCASQPKSPPVTHAAAQQGAAPSETLAANLDEVLKAGYEVVDENGKTLYCREQLKTGSHMRKDVICLTADELRVAREASQRNLEQMKRQTPPPRGN